MKIALVSLPELPCGKQNIKDSRLDQVDAITKSKKKTYVQVELVSEENLKDADAIMVAANASTDLVLKDLEFVETRLGRATTEEEKALLLKLKGVLEGEQFIARANLNDAEKQALAGYTLFTVKPIVIVDQQMLADPQGLLAKALADSGYISFFTTGEKETRAWLIRKGTTAHEAAGAIHTDIQRGFIRAEIISLNDFLSCGGETQAKQAGKLRSEQKEYIMQDADLVNFRFNK